MGFKIGKSLGSIGGAIAGAFAGGPVGAIAGAQIGNALFGGNDDEMTALQAYQMQRADALSDWQRQNAYNSPVEQMKRLQAAGLNPYLVYSGGNVTGNSSSGIDNVTYNGSYAQPTSKRLQNVLQNLNLRSLTADTKGKEVDTEMRELDLELKRLRIAALANGHTGNNPLVEQKLQLQVDKLNKELNKGGFFTERYKDLKELATLGRSDVVDYMAPRLSSLKESLSNSWIGSLANSGAFEWLRRMKYGN